jgi:hypothetical protein
MFMHSHLSRTFRVLLVVLLISAFALSASARMQLDPKDATSMRHNSFFRVRKSLLSIALSCIVAFFFWGTAAAQGFLVSLFFL